MAGGGDGDGNASDDDKEEEEDDSLWVQSSLSEGIFNYLLSTRGKTILSLRRESLS